MGGWIQKRWAYQLEVLPNCRFSPTARLLKRQRWPASLSCKQVTGRGEEGEGRGEYRDGVGGSRPAHPSFLFCGQYSRAGYCQHKSHLTLPFSSLDNATVPVGLWDALPLGSHMLKIVGTQNSPRVYMYIILSNSSVIWNLSRLVPINTQPYK